MFYTFNQNNSGGFFDYDEEAGITHFVIIEANSAKEANRRLENIGGYFNGIDTGQDCACCGDRWYPTYADEGYPEPMLYGEPVSGYDWKPSLTWMKAGREVAVHYKDGRIEWFGKEKN